MSTRAKRVMLVDDDEDFIEMNKAILEANGYCVAVAYNGMECLSKVRAVKPDLIVLDAMMTTLSDGFNVSRELRNCELTEGIPILMVTAISSRFASKFEPDETWLPVDAFIEKPVAPQQLLEEVNRRLQE